MFSNFSSGMNSGESIEDEVLQTIGFNMKGQEDNIRDMISSKVTMPSTSKSKRKIAKKSKFVPKPKQQWQVKQPTRNWLELPSDLMATILYRIGVFDILENAQKVCTTWRKICKDPSMWRVIKMVNFSDPTGRPICQEMCKNAVDRSQGQLVDISITDFCTDELLQYIADRSSQLKRLEVIYCFGEMYDCWGEALKKLPLLEELSLDTTEISEEDIESVGHYCPMLKTLKVNQEMCYSYTESNDEESLTIRNAMAITIGKNLHNLRHLELVEDTMTNIGLQAILDGCCHLESLDLRRCLYVDLKGDLGKKCSQQIKYLKLPHDSLEGLPHRYENANETCDVLDDSDSDDGYNGYFDYDDYDEYDDYTAFGNDDSMDFEDLSDMIAFMAMFG